MSPASSPVSARTPSLESIRLAVARSYLDYAQAICHQIAKDPIAPLPAAQLRILREAADRRDDPGGGGGALLNTIIITLLNRTVARTEHNKLNPGAITTTRTEQRALNLLESLATERDIAAGIPIPLTPREQRMERIRQAQDLSRSEARINRALDREALRADERETLEELRAESRAEQSRPVVHGSSRATTPPAASAS